VPARIDHTTTSGTFSLDGGSWDVENNVWIVGDDVECVIIDAPHQAGPILDLVAGRTVLAILCTHAHDDHVTVAVELSEKFSAPIRLHPDEDVLWRRSYPDASYEPLTDGEVITVAGTQLQVIHTPGHAPGAVCFYAPRDGNRFLRRHTISRRPRRHRPIVLQLRHHRGLHLVPTANPAR
jgi:glyoxylase-like metal-dependent hydrolase (beta-lactamase superfamily II)